jgi:DNA topoisomerase VI subunit B
MKAARQKHTLERETFTLPRLMEHFTKEELSKRIGHPKHLWPLALLKELVDNALDEVEVGCMGGVPRVTVLVERDALTVRDNGRGLPADVLLRTLDFSSRTSSKLGYVSLTRGQLGNALQTVYAAPFVVDGKQGRLEVAAHGVLHRITIGLDRIAQAPRLEIAREPSEVTVGTFLKLHWPGIAGFLGGEGDADSYRADDDDDDDDEEDDDEDDDDEDVPAVITADRLLRAYATFNPHVSFVLGADKWPAADHSWEKFQPDHPTSPHWYSNETLRTLIAARVARERDGGRALTLRDFVAEFRGLKRTGVRKEVLEAAGLAGEMLRDLVAGQDIDKDAVQDLLAAMQEKSRSVKPRALGVLGKDHLSGRLEGCYGVAPRSVRYKCKLGGGRRRPFVLEVAFGVKRRGEAGGRDVVVGLNWTPALAPPFPELGDQLGKMRLDRHDPVVLLVHLAFPRPSYTDHGKARVDLPHAVADGLRKCVHSVAREWKAAKHKADRKDRLSERRLEELRKAQQPKELKINEAACLVLEEAYLHASGNKADPANARQVMYAARPRVLALTGGKCWKHSSYFTQTLLPEFIEAHPELTADWDVVYDARGHLVEPHTGERIDLGTLQVREYIGGWTLACPDTPPEVVLSTRCPTKGPANRYRFALFVEKEGFYALLERHRIADRYDVAIMSTKGMSVTSARRLVDELSQRGVTVLVLRDFDKPGFSIVHTLQTDSPRYRFRSKPKVKDIGLHLKDVRKWNLEPLAEPVEYKRAKKDPREMLRAAGATEEECGFLVSDGPPLTVWSGRRVELNAFTSPRFIEFLEYKFKKAGVAKVVPSGEDLRTAYARAWGMAGLQEAFEKALAESSRGTPPDMPEDMPARLAEAIKGTAEPWDDALAKIVRTIRGEGEQV